MTQAPSRRSGMTTLGAAGAAVALLATLAALRAFLAGHAPPSPLPGGAAAIGAAAAALIILLGVPARWVVKRRTAEEEAQGEAGDAVDRA